MSIKANYEIKTDNDRVLAVDAYFYSDVSNFVYHKFYTIDKQVSKLVTLSGLFNPDTDYITPISTYIVTEMKRLNTEEGGMFDVGDNAFAAFTEIKHDQNFYINENGKLVICCNVFKFKVVTKSHDCYFSHIFRQ